MSGQSWDAVLDRAVLLRDVCRGSGVPDPVMLPDGVDGLLLVWDPGGVEVVIRLSVDGSVRWTDPARPAGIVFEVFSPEPFVVRVAEWYDGGPIIDGRRISLEELREIRAGDGDG